MDAEIQYNDPVKEDLIKSTVSLAAGVRSALALLSMSAPPLEGLKASVVEKVKGCEEVFAQNEEPKAYMNGKKKVSDMAVYEKLAASF